MKKYDVKLVKIIKNYLHSEKQCATISLANVKHGIIQTSRGSELKKKMEKGVWIYTILYCLGKQEAEKQK